LENLRRNAPQWNEARGPVVVLGAGGAARAVVAALLDLDVVEIRLLNRTKEKADALAESLGGPINIIDWSEREDALDGSTLLLNTTTLGMVGQPRLELSLAALTKMAVVYDLVYAPLETELLSTARSLGLSTVDGLGMLFYQAAPGFEGWFGVQPVVTDGLRDSVLSTP
jgi:shikimate dehydrogenase